jgi:peptidoglycan/LPS O-acetylase OafA/YrhL
LSTLATPTSAGSAGGQQAEAPSPALAPPPGNPRFPLFDGLRGIAVVGILAYHVFEISAQLGLSVPGKLAEVAGTQAVLWFFAISGFLLYRPYVAARWRGRSGAPVRRYARRRALRILPGYWAILTILAIFPGIVGPFSSLGWRYYGYLQLYSKRTLTGGIPVAWTLCVEVVFYIALPVWAGAVRRLPDRRRLLGELLPLAAVAGAGAVIQIAAARLDVSHLLGSSLAGQITWIALGMALAALSVAAQWDPTSWPRVRQLAEHAGLWWAIGIAAFAGQVALVPGGGVFGLIGALRTPQPLGQSVLKVGLEVIVTVAFLLPAVFGPTARGLPRRVLASAPVVWLGVISYSFYLWHFTVIEFIAWSRNPGVFSTRGLGLLNHLHTARTSVLFVASFVATALLATASYQFVELPFLRRKG